MLKYKRILFVIIGVILFYSVECQYNDVKDGYKKFYYKTGKISSEGFMKNGKPDGYWKTYYPTGVLKSEGNRKNYLLDRIWVFYSIYGDTIEKINYLLGRKNGYSYKYYSDRSNEGEFIGNVLSKELYVNDKKEGISYYYKKDGYLEKIINYRENKPDGFGYEFSDGIIVTIIRYNKGNIVERERINRFNEEGLKEGTWKEFYKNFVVKKEEDFKNGLREGTYKEYLENGDLIIRIKYKNDRIVEDDEVQDSVEIRNETDNNGNIVFSGTYKNNIPIGIHRFFDEKGDVKKSYLYNDSGIKISEGIINLNGSKEGSWINYYRNGKIKSEGKYFNNKENGNWKYYFENEKIEQTGDYKNGFLTGVWRWYFEDGKIRKEESYLNGKEEGESVEYDEEGNIVSKGEFIDGEKEGFWRTTVNDHIEEGNYVSGLRDGKWKYYYIDGTIKFEGSYVQGNPDGKHKYYYENGILKEEQYYVQGFKEKHWKKYDKEGNLIITISYMENKEIRINGEKLDLTERNVKIIR